MGAAGLARNQLIKGIDEAEFRAMGQGKKGGMHGNGDARTLADPSVKSSAEFAGAANRWFPSGRTCDVLGLSTMVIDLEHLALARAARGSGRAGA